MSNTDFTEKAIPDVAQPSPPPPPPPDPSAMAADLGSQLGGSADRPPPPSSLRASPWPDAFPTADQQSSRQPYLRRTGPVHPREWGQPDYILQGAMNYPGISPGPWMPQVNEVSPLIQKAVNYLTQHGSGPVQAFAANMGLSRGAYDKAFIQGQIARATYEREQYAFNQKRLKDRMEEELRGAGSLFSEYADNPNLLRQKLIEFARENNDTNLEHMVTNQNLDDVKKHLDEMNGYYSDLGKIESQRLKDEWYKAQIEKIHAEIKGGGPPSTPEEPPSMVTSDDDPATPEVTDPAAAASPDTAPIPSGDVPPPDESAAPPPAGGDTAPPSPPGGPPAAVSPEGPATPAAPETPSPAAAAAPAPAPAPAAGAQPSGGAPTPAQKTLQGLPKFPAPSIVPQPDEGAAQPAPAAPGAPAQATPAQATPTQLFPPSPPPPGAPAAPKYPTLKVAIPPAQPIVGMSAAELDDWGRRNYEKGELPNPPSRGAKPFNDWRDVQNQAVRARGEMLKAAEEQVLKKVPPINPGDDVETRIRKTEGAVKALESIDPAVARRVGAILRGDLPSPNLPSRYGNPLLQKLGDITLRLDPGFSDLRHETNKNTQRLFISGWAGQQRIATNRALEHSDSLLGFVNKLPNTNFTLANGARASFYQMLGRPEYTQFKEAWGHVAQELTRAFRGSAGALGDINRELQNVNNASSPDQVKGALRTIGELLKGQQDAMADLYSRGTYKHVSGEDLLAPEARAAFHELMTLKDSQGRSLGPQGNISSDFGREPGEPTADEQKALEWLKTNSSDPRADRIRQMLIQRGLL